MYIEIDSNNQVMGYSDNETANAVETDKAIPSFTDTQILKFVSGDFVVEDSQDLIDAKAQYDALEYSRNRKAEYPDWSVQLEKIYDDGIDKWKSEMVDPVKAKYPKP